MGKRIIILVILLSNVVIAFSQNEHMRIWNNTSDRDTRNIKSMLTIFTPQDSLRNGIAIIICPGGSYCYLGMDIEGYSIARKFNEMGITAFVLRYRVGMHAHKHPDMIEDLQRSIQIVREGYNRWNIDTTKIGIVGFSAGGHLAGTAAMFSDSSFLQKKGIKCNVSLRPDFVALIYPVVTLSGELSHVKSRKSFCGGIENADLQQAFSLEQHVHDHVPPVFIAHAKDDLTVDYRNSSQLYEKLQINNIESKYLLYETGGHGFGINTKKGGNTANWIYELEKWIKVINI